MKVLITGSAGFIGSNLCETLARNGMDIFGIDNLDDYYSPILKIDRLRWCGFKFNDSSREDSDRQVSSGKSAFPVPEKIYASQRFQSLRFARIDIRSPKMKDIVEYFKPDVIVHLAARPGVRNSMTNPEECMEANVLAFISLLELCRETGIRRLLYASSSAVYGDRSSHAFRETDPIEFPKSIYAISKRTNEMIAKVYADMYGIRATGLRFFSVYGEWGRPDMAPYLFTEALINERPITLYKAGCLSRDFTYIDDVTEGIRRIICTDDISDAENCHEVLNIGHGTPTRVSELLSLLEKIIGKKAHKVILPMQPGDVHTTLSDSTRFLDKYGYKPATSLEKGLKNFVNWYLDYHNSLIAKTNETDMNV